jgi:hypothetical protein
MAAAAAAVVSCGTSSIPQSSGGPARAGAVSELGIAEAHPSLVALKLPPVHAGGAIGFNYPTWYSLGEQRRSSVFVLKGLVSRDTSMLSTGVAVMEFSFAHQLPDGSFRYTPPPGSGNATKTSDPVGTAFFYADLGHSLELLDESTWFQTSPETSALRQRVEALRTGIGRGLDWLLEPAQMTQLQQTGHSGTNRWTFGINGLVLVGQWASDQSAVQQGMRLLQDVLGSQQPDGTFPERGGFDSSYQGVTLSNLVVLDLHLSAGDSSVKPSLQSAIARGVDRERRAIQADGQIVTLGNTRVFCGGETFLGKPKGGDYQGVVTAFLYDSAIRNDAALASAAQSVASHYAGTKGGPAACGAT